MPGATPSSPEFSIAIKAICCCKLFDKPPCPYVPTSNKCRRGLCTGHYGIRHEHFGGLPTLRNLSAKIGAPRTVCGSLRSAGQPSLIPELLNLDMKKRSVIRCHGGRGFFWPPSTGVHSEYGPPSIPGGMVKCLECKENNIEKGGENSIEPGFAKGFSALPMPLGMARIGPVPVGF